MERNTGKPITALDAVRLLCNAVQKIHHFDHHNEGEGISPPCHTMGEFILQDALEYLAWGDTRAARELMDIYDGWVATGRAPWPYAAGNPPPDAEERNRDGNDYKQDPGGGVWLENGDDMDDGIPF